MSIAQRPGGVHVATSGAAPLAGITAMTSIDALELSAGDTVLIVGATGGVGSLAVQLAAAAALRSSLLRCPTRTTYATSASPRSSPAKETSRPPCVDATPMASTL
jgi:D-arabinose 1-dehydrogenase-like Zn-dependent alcohol dehydrogenase